MNIYERGVHRYKLIDLLRNSQESDRLFRGDRFDFFSDTGADQSVIFAACLQNHEINKAVLKVDLNETTFFLSGSIKPI